MSRTTPNPGPPNHSSFYTVTRFLSFVIVLIVFSLVACGSTKSTRSAEGAEKLVGPYADYANYYVDFMHTDRLSEAIDRAKAEDKLVFIDFYTSWCLPCKLMDEDVFTDRKLGEFMNANFVSIKVNAELGNGPNLAALYQVQSYPTLLFLDANGRVKTKKEGAAYQTELRRLGNEALAAAN